MRFSSLCEETGTANVSDTFAFIISCPFAEEVAHTLSKAGEPCKYFD
jgi:hypothetical protein